jgi:hypothetical protein
LFLSNIDSTKAFLVYKNTGTGYNAARVVTISGSSAPSLGTANTSSVSNVDDNISAGIFKVSSTEFIVTGDLGTENYTVSGTTVTFVGEERHAIISPSETGRIHSYQILELKFGDNYLTHGRDENIFLIRSKLGSYLHIKQKNISFPRTFFASSGIGSAASAWIELDSTTALGVTNNNGTTTISATIIKYIGS